MSGPAWHLEETALIPGVTISADLQTQHLDVAVPLSIAISLKRIADVIGTADLSNIGAQIETIAWNAGRTFESGRRQS